MIRTTGLGTRLRALAALLDGDLEQFYARLGDEFRPRFYPFALYLDEHETAQIGELAKAADVTQPAATQTINEMVRLGLVEVAPGEDRRVRTISLSARGKATVSRLRPLWSAVVAAARELDGELPFALSILLDHTIAALRQRPFADRIEHHLKG